MKKKFVLTGMLFVANALCVLPSYGEVNKEECRLAVDVLKGKDTIRSKEWAVQLLEASQEEEPDAYIKNVLGISYLHGIGTDSDTAKAVLYFNQAGELGYPLAYHNLGMYYKYAPSGKQDFVKAFEAFRKGAEAGSPTNNYNCGYMLYKGFGCEQDYSAAVEKFRSSADLNHAPSLYMLGLCYRNGYGVEVDTAVASFYLKQSAALGYSDAMEELLNENAETAKTWYDAMLDNDVKVQEEMPVVVPYLPLNSQAIAGRYLGQLVTYDWSGSQIISEQPLQVDMSVKSDSAFGMWIQGKDTIVFAALITDGGTLRFNRTEKSLYDRYSPSFYSRYRFERIDMNYNRGFITGGLCLYSLDELEPQRPMYVSLRKDDVSSNSISEDEYAKMVAYSDPVSGRVVLKFELDEAVPSVKVGVYSQFGNIINSYTYGSLEAGITKLTILPNLSEGYYVIYVWAGTHKYQAVVGI